MVTLLDVFLIWLSVPDIYIKETEDNEAVVSTLIDLHRLLTFKHLPAVQGWIQVRANVWIHIIDCQLWGKIIFGID